MSPGSIAAVEPAAGAAVEPAASATPGAVPAPSLRKTSAIQDAFIPMPCIASTPSSSAEESVPARRPSSVRLEISSAVV